MFLLRERISYISERYPLGEGKQYFFFSLCGRLRVDCYTRLLTCIYAFLKPLSWNPEKLWDCRCTDDTIERGILFSLTHYSSLSRLVCRRQLSFSDLCECLLQRFCFLLVGVLGAELTSILNMSVETNLSLSAMPRSHQ